MARVSKIFGTRNPTRIHFLAEWAERRGMIQADIARELGVDKGTVSRWFDGFLPKEQTIPLLAEILSIEPSALFRHPDDDWIARIVSGRNDDEKQRIIAMIDAAFPRRMTGG
jgi:transcriptional regulator with XRE-family HTH domain